MPSIFNDVIGPVMRGPSSSHTAAAYRIGNLVRQLCPLKDSDILVEFDRQGALATTYEGQGSAMGLIAAFLGIDILDEAMVDYRKLAEEKGLRIRFEISDLAADHPNTYQLSISSPGNGTLQIKALSTGGGMVDIRQINGMDVSIRGDCFVVLLALSPQAQNSVESLVHRIQSELDPFQLDVASHEAEGYLLTIKSRSPLGAAVRRIADRSGAVLWLLDLEPVMPVLAGHDAELPFSSLDEMLALAEGDRLNLAQLAERFEGALAGIDPDEVLSRMEHLSLIIRESIDTGLRARPYGDRILGPQSHLMAQAEASGRIPRNALNRIIAYVSAIMECKSSMGIIVAAPTAGSCGVIGGLLWALAEDSALAAQDMARAFLGAGMIGVFIAKHYTFAAEEGGCQVECGAASAMAAAALVQLMGGSAREAVNAASLALQNMLGLVCDPVADRVEVPCLGKNILGATNAWACANMILAGYDALIPLDEVIESLKSVGNSLPSTLCCTGLGGLACTPTAKRWYEKLKKKGDR